MTQDIVKQIIIKNLNLSASMSDLILTSPLLGAIPELDSMAVVSIITSLEESFGFTIYDDEISSENFQSLGSLVEFVEIKLNG